MPRRPATITLTLTRLDRATHSAILVFEGLTVVLPDVFLPGPAEPGDSIRMTLVVA